MMKKTILTLLATMALTAGASAQMLVLNEVYPGGGASSGTPAYTRDFVELYNPSATPFSLASFSLQYASASGNFTGTIVNFGAGSVIGGNDYLTVETGTTGSLGATLAAGTGAGFATYVAPTNSASLSASSGSVRLFNTNTSTVVDLLGYGTVNLGSLGDAKAEGTAATAPTSTAVSLNRTGFADTDNNKNDFSSMTPTPNAGTLSVVVPVVVPEPSTWAFVAGGLGGLTLLIRRRRVA